MDWFNDIPSTAAIYLDPDGTPRDEGSTLQNPDLARTYRRIARNGADWFYDGPPAAPWRGPRRTREGRRRQPRLASQLVRGGVLELEPSSRGVPSGSR